MRTPTATYQQFRDRVGKLGAVPGACPGPSQRKKNYAGYLEGVLRVGGLGTYKEIPG